MPGMATSQNQPASGPLWTVGAACAALALLLAWAYLLWALNGPGDESKTAVAVGEDGSGATGTIPEDGSGPLTYSGGPPASLSPADFTRIEDGTKADLVFAITAGAGDGAPYRHWQPVAAQGAAVDALTMTQLQALLSANANWTNAGGIAGKVTFAVAGPPADQKAQLQFAGGSVVPGASFESYEALRAAMTVGSGILTFVPLVEVRPSVMAIAVDGMDPVRGRGELAAWPFIERLTIRGETKRGKDAAAALAFQLVAKLPPAITVAATGDILMSRCTLAKIEATGDWGAPLRSPVGEYLAAAHLALGSLDGSLQDINQPFRCVKGTNLSSPVESVQALTLAGIDSVTVATNHVFDCGIAYCAGKAFLRTLEVLTAAGIKHVGGGNNLEEALAPAIFEIGGVKLGVLGFDDVAAMDLEATATEPGTAPLDDDYSEERAANEPAFYRPASELGITRFVDRITKLKAQVDVVIVQVQSGTEDTHTPTERSIKALRAAADAGADLVVGNQAHWVQAVEPRGGAFIAYALGNFIFDQLHTPEHSQGFLLEATFWGRELVNVRLLPYQITNQLRPEFVTGATRTKILDDVFTASAELPKP